MATPVAINLIFINAIVVNVSWGRGEASEGRESLIMNRSPTLAVRRCNEYAFCVGLDHCHETDSESLLLLKGSKFLQSSETLTCSVPSFLQTRRGLLLYDYQEI